MRKSYIFDGCHAEILFSWQLELLNALWLQGSMLVYVIKPHNHKMMCTDLLPFCRMKILFFSVVFPTGNFVPGD